MVDPWRVVFNIPSNGYWVWEVVNMSVSGKRSYDWYERTEVFCKWDGLVQNRVKVSNGYCEDRIRYRYRRDAHRYEVTYGEHTLASYEVYDVEGARDAYQRLDAVTELLWALRF